ncbi:uromodulin-like isoform X2 [Stylophora pistillata]|uniref:uromodulin-like isoform X2 n=1 Tax=Stylophora pistillata TaxID=50429 RepID=UPI000C04E38B|nr:uromodulin-like isoform X2 [Stylophora pistillata]
MLWASRSIIFLILRSLMDFSTAKDRCRIEVNIPAPLGSIPELPALSCSEIKLSEGQDSLSKTYWLDPTGIGKAVLVYCDMKMEDIDECKGDNPVCDVNAYCSNTYGSYNCSCKEGYTGDGRSCSQADACYQYQYKNLSNATRKNTYNTSGPNIYCDDKLPMGWYRFVGAAGNKMATTCVSEFRCGTYWSGWLSGVHPTVGDGDVSRTVCFRRGSCCRYSTQIVVKNCGSYYIYKLSATPRCDMRYCGSD